ncbi:hypothetical protein [Stomatohabitans albus]|uniref:hypothetical protein n=1 Tax=Stomatohabitans albus TaxID=3110766 RepID=UPI00300C87F5
MLTETQIRTTLGHTLAQAIGAVLAGDIGWHEALISADAPLWARNCLLNIAMGLPELDRRAPIEVLEACADQIAHLYAEVPA